MDQSIIKVKNVTLNLANSPILNAINLNVKYGTIFGLIGPSGCGKTTLIRAILGLLPFQAGSITVASETPSQVTRRQIVGYMPQDLALTPVLTPREMMEFCGRVYQIKRQDLDTIVNILFNGFNITQPDTLIGLLNTGQKRRVSLCCALIHKPRLAILDEPTVGSDPLVRRNIWRYVKKCSLQEGMTVIITTHYFEEVMAADEIGFMRRGQFIVKGNPRQILKNYQVNTLEEALFQICKNNQLEVNPESKSHLESIHVENTVSRDVAKLQSLDELRIVSSSSRQYKLDESNQTPASSLVIMLAIFWRITRKLRWVYFVTMISCFINFSTIFLMEQYFRRPPKDLPVCIVSNEYDSDLMEKFLTQFDQGILNMTFCSDHDTALTQVQHGLLIGFLEMPDYYLNSIEDVLAVRNDSHRDLRSFIDLGLVKFRGDYSNLINGKIVEKVIQLSLVNYFKYRFTEHDFSPKQLSYVHIEPVFGTLKQDDETSRHYTRLPRAVLWIVHFFGLAVMIFNLELENWDKFIERQYSMGIETRRIILVHAFYGMVILFPVFCVFYYVFTFFLGLPLFNWYNLIFTIFMALTDLSGMCTGLLLFAPVGTLMGAVVLLCGYTLTGFWVSGLIQPFQALPYWVAPIACLPVSLALSSRLEYN